MCTWVGMAAGSSSAKLDSPWMCIGHWLVYAAGGLSKEYRTKFRSLVFNLTDTNNPDLRARVLQVGMQ